MVVRFQRNHRVTGLTAQDVHTLDVNAGLLQAVGDAGQRARFIGQAEYQSIVAHGFETGPVQDVERPAVIVGGQYNCALFADDLGVD